MNPALPPRLKAAANALLEGVSRKELAAGSAAISGHYRQGQGSAVAIADGKDALAYLVARLPATYAVAAAALAQVSKVAPNFHPSSALDVGAGPGTASWAAVETWPDLQHIAMTDSNPRFVDLARTLAAQSDHEALVTATFIAGELTDGKEFRRADLVTASFVLAEIAAAFQQAVVEQLFAGTNDVLVLIEPGTPAGFERIRAARAVLIGHDAQVLAPCTHANACPIIAPDWCHFSQRLPRSRDHMQAKSARVPYEDERYSWVAVSRTGKSAHEGLARILAPPKDAKSGLTLKLCTSGGVEKRFVARRDKDAFMHIRKAKWGDVV